MNRQDIKDLQAPYVYVYGKIRSGSWRGSAENRSSMIGRGNILEVLKWHIRIPKAYQLNFLDTMEKGIKCPKCGFSLMPCLIRKGSRESFELLKPRLNIPRDFYGNPLWS